MFFHARLPRIVLLDAGQSKCLVDLWALNCFARRKKNTLQNTPDFIRSKRDLPNQITPPPHTHTHTHRERERERDAPAPRLPCIGLNVATKKQADLFTTIVEASTGATTSVGTYCSGCWSAR